MVDCLADDCQEPIISTTHGQVRGKLRETVYGDHYYCFDGIPYAKPPLAELRFRSPQPLDKPWSGVRDCTEMPPRCIQHSPFSDHIQGSEDCLYLNIYAKKLNSDKPLPVMVYIYGGMFMFGSALRAHWGPDYLMMKDIILVTIGFRTGVFGFLALPEPELQVSGNAALKDILLALKWLKSNYRNFNGDPNNVTLFGQSSGAFTAHALMMSPKCEGLFQRAILLSGVVKYIHPVDKLPYRFAKHCGYDGPEDNKKILDYLLALEAAKLCDLHIFSQTEKDQGRIFPFCTTVESASVADAIITEDVWQMFANKQKWSHKLPMMLGTTSFESLTDYAKFTADPKRYDLLKIHPEYMLPLHMTALCDLAARQKLARKLMKYHLGAKELCEENVFDMLRLISHGYSYHPMYHYLCSRLRHAEAPTYFYRFDFDSPNFNFYRNKMLGHGISGVAHVDDLSYIFYMPPSYKLARDSDEFQTIVRMMDILTSFATNSNPNGESVKPVVWEPLSKYADTYKCLNISNELSFIDWPEMEACQVWDQCYREAGLRL